MSDDSTHKDEQDFDDNEFNEFDDQDVGVTVGTSTEPAAGESSGARGSRRTTVTQVARSATAKFKAQKDESPNKFYIILAGIGFAVVLLIGIIVWASSQSAQRPQLRTPNFTTNVGVDQDSSSKIQAFIAAQEEKYTQLEADSLKQKREYEAAKLANQRLIETLQESREKALRELEEAKQQMRDATLIMEELAERGPLLTGGAGGSSQGAPTVANYESFLKSLRDQYANNLLSVADARKRIQQRLIADGHSADDPELAGVIDSIMDRLGMRFVGEVAEKPVTQEEIASLPSELQNLFPEVVQYVRSLATVEGQVLIRVDQVQRLVKSRLPTNTYDADTINRLALLSRIRMTNVPPRIEGELGRLVALRDSKGIGQADLRAIEEMVWEQRLTLPGLTPGIQLALISAIARLEGSPSVSESERKTRTATADDLAAARIRVRRSIETQMGSGSTDQNDLLVGARNALRAFMDDGGLEISDNVQDQIVLVELRRVLLGEKDRIESGSEPVTETTATASKDSEDDKLPRLFIGPFSFTERQAGVVATMMVPHIAEQMGLDPATPMGAASITAMTMNAYGLGQQTFVDFVETPTGIRGWADAVVRALIEIGFDGSALARADFAIPGIKNDTLTEYARAVLVATRIGQFIQDDERLVESFNVLKNVADREAILNRNQVTSLNGIASEGWERLTEVQAIVAPQAQGNVFRRLGVIRPAHAELMKDGTDHVGRLANNAVLGDLGKLASQDLQTTLPTLLSTIFAITDDGRLSTEELTLRGRLQLRRFVALLVGESITMDQVTTTQIRPFISQISEEGGGLAHVLTSLREVTPDLLVTVLDQQKPRLGDDNLVDVGTALANRIQPTIRQTMVQEVVLTNVVPRIRRAGRTYDSAAVIEAIEFVQRLAEEVIEPPYEVARVNDWIIILGEEGLAVLEGRKVPDTRSRDGERNEEVAAGTPRVPFPPVIPARFDGNGQRPLGVVETRTQGKHIQLNSGTYANAIITTGASAEIGGEGNVPVLIEMPVTFHGPGGGLIHMPKVRFIGQGNPRAGAERLSIVLRRLSYRFPNGRAIDVDINGYVADNIDGKEGALGRFVLNGEKVLPAAVGAGFFSGIGEALNNEASVVEVTTGGTTTTTDSGSSIERALIGGTSEAANILSDYVRQYMEDIRPTIEVPNGQPVTVILLDPVVFDDVTEEDWASLRVNTGISGF